jgi:3'-phosphoadenosine 5'-phosphosulfate sulfotransferase (PAPS reductase)/FAD synthetase
MNIIFSSYGNDSIALIQWAHNSGLDDVHVVFTDTGWSPGWWVDRRKNLNVWVRSLGFTVVEIASEGMEALVRRKKAWPRGGGGKYQFCTEALKEAPAREWLDSVDPNCDATCLIGVRREESANRMNHPEFIVESDKHGGRELWAPLVRHTELMRNDLLAEAGVTPLPFRSKECYPCVNARKGELRNLGEEEIKRIEAIEIDMGINSKGNPRVMFSPKREGGAVGIRAVVENAKKSKAKNMPDAGLGCTAGYCGN